MILSINPDNPQQRLLQQVVTMLRQGAVVCYPTDTVYGIGCDIYNQKAVKRVHGLKRRSHDKPFSFMCSSLKNVSTYCHVSNYSYRTMKRLLPGPYTFVLPTMKIVPKIMVSKQKTVGIRVPDNRICNQLAEILGNPIVTTSAVLGEEEPASNVFELEDRLGKLVDVIITDGGLFYSEPSTVVSMVDEPPLILREGKGGIDQL